MFCWVLGAGDARVTDVCRFGRPRGGVDREARPADFAVGRHLLHSGPLLRLCDGRAYRVPYRLGLAGIRLRRRRVRAPQPGLAQTLILKLALSPLEQ